MITSANKLSKGDKIKNDIAYRTLKHSKSAHNLKMDNKKANESIKTKVEKPLSKTIVELKKEL
jgi:hypothetical protein